jgi:hypothetical protein
MYTMDHTNYRNAVSWARHCVDLLQDAMRYDRDQDYNDQWGIVMEAPASYYGDNSEELLDNSNYDCIYADMHKRFPRYVENTYGIVVMLFRKDGTLTQAGWRMYDIMYKLQDYIIYNDDDFSMREWESDREGNQESIRQELNHFVLVPECDSIPVSDIVDRVLTYMDQNDSEAVNYASTGCSGKGGYIDPTAIHASLYAMGLIDLTAYNQNEIDDLENKLSDYAWNSASGIRNAFESWKSGL